MLGTYGVSVWKSIRSGWLDFSEFLQFDVGDGTRIKFWEDVWCRDCSLKEAFLELYSIIWAREFFVSKVMCFSNGGFIGTFSFVVHHKIGSQNHLIVFGLCFIPQMCGVLVMTNFVGS